MVSHCRHTEKNGCGFDSLTVSFSVEFEFECLDSSQSRETGMRLILNCQ